MKKYNILYADPPWQWTKGKLINRGSARAVEKEYNTMTFEELLELPINEISEDNSICFMWVTFPKLKLGIELMEKWGFNYITNAFTWIKKNKKATDTNFWGMGFYTRANAEICILGKKGKGLKRISNSVHSVIESPIREHSRKPDEARDKIVELFGELPRIELFSRTKSEGWDVWGNQTEKFV